MKTELILHTTLYFEVPEGMLPEDYMQELHTLNKDDMLKRVTIMDDYRYFEIQELE